MFYLCAFRVRNDSVCLGYILVSFLKKRKLRISKPNRATSTNKNNYHYCNKQQQSFYGPKHIQSLQRASIVINRVVSRFSLPFRKIAIIKFTAASLSVQALIHTHNRYFKIILKCWHFGKSRVRGHLSKFF